MSWSIYRMPWTSTENRMLEAESKNFSHSNIKWCKRCPKANAEWRKPFPKAEPNAMSECNFRNRMPKPEFRDFSESLSRMHCSRAFSKSLSRMHCLRAFSQINTEWRKLFWKPQPNALSKGLLWKWKPNALAECF